MAFTERAKQKIKRAVRQTLNETPKSGGIGGRVGNGTAYDGFWAKIVAAGPSGEADYTDTERYWFKLAQLTTTVDDNKGTNVWTVPNTDDTEYLCATLTDVASKRSATRILKIDDIVWVFETPDVNNDTTVIRYFCDSGGGGLPSGQYQYQVFQMVAQNQTGFGIIQAHPVI